MGGAGLPTSQTVINQPASPCPAFPHPQRLEGPALNGQPLPTPRAQQAMRPGVGDAAGFAWHTRRWGQQAGLPLTPAALPVGGGGVVRHKKNQRCPLLGSRL